MPINSGGGDRGEGDVAPLPEHPGEDEDAAEHGERRQDKEDAEGGSSSRLIELDWNIEGYLKSI